MVTETKVIAMLAALERMKLYCAAHPTSPVAARQPRLYKRAQCWVAVLRVTEKGRICRIGASVEAAFRAFDEIIWQPCIRRRGASGKPPVRQPRTFSGLEPTTGFEPVTYGLRNRCSTS